MEKIYFITAIDTDAGKSIVTGVMAAYLKSKGVNVITQKMSQTGCVGTSEDIETHRRIMGTEFFPEDTQGLTCPYIFPFPAAPQLSAELVGERIDFHKIHGATVELAERYECVLMEGVGGLMVPLRDDLTVLDYMERYPQPTILVTNGKLGSINHTLLSLEVCKSRNVPVIGMVYNNCIATDPAITKDTLKTLQRRLSFYYPAAKLVEMPKWEEGTPFPDFSPIFGI